LHSQQIKKSGVKIFREHFVTFFGHGPDLSRCTQYVVFYYQSPAVGRWLIVYLVVSVCASVYNNLCKQDMSKTNNRSLSNLQQSLRTCYPKMITSDADHTGDGWKRMAQNLQFSCGPSSKRRKRITL